MIAKTLKAVGRDLFQASLLPSRSSLNTSNGVLSVDVSVSECKFPLCVRIQSYWIRAYPDNLILIWPCLQIKSHSQILGIRTSTSFGGCNSTHNSKVDVNIFSICSYTFFLLPLLFTFLIPQQPSLLRSIFEDKFKMYFFEKMKLLVEHLEKFKWLNIYFCILFT